MKKERTKRIIGKRIPTQIIEKIGSKSTSAKDIGKIGAEYIDDDKLPTWMRSFVIKNSGTGFKQTEFGILFVEKNKCHIKCVWCNDYVYIEYREKNKFRLFTQFCHRSGYVECIGNKTQSLFNILRMSEIPQDTSAIDRNDGNDGNDSKEDLDSYDIIKNPYIKELIGNKTMFTFDNLNEESKIILKRLCFDDEIDFYIQKINKVFNSKSLSCIMKFMDDQRTGMSCKNKMQLIPRPEMIQMLILIGRLSKKTIKKLYEENKYPHLTCYAQPDNQTIHNCIYIFLVGLARKMSVNRINKNEKELLCCLYIKCGRAEDENDRSDKHFNNFLDRVNPEKCTSPGKGLCIDGCKETFYRFRKACIISASTQNDKSAEAIFHFQLKCDMNNLYVHSFKIGVPESNKNAVSREVFRFDLRIRLRDNRLPNDHPFKPFEKDILEIFNSKNKGKTFGEKFKNEEFHDCFLNFAKMSVESDKQLMWYLYSSSLSEHSSLNVFNIRQGGDTLNTTNKIYIEQQKTKITSLKEEVKEKTQELEKERQKSEEERKKSEEKIQELEKERQKSEEKTQELEEKIQELDSLSSDLEIVLDQRDHLKSMLKEHVSENIIEQKLKEVVEEHRKNNSSSDNEALIEGMANLEV